MQGCCGDSWAGHDEEGCRSRTASSQGESLSDLQSREAHPDRVRPARTRTRRAVRSRRDRTRRLYRQIALRRRTLDVRPVRSRVELSGVRFPTLSRPWAKDWRLEVTESWHAPYGASWYGLTGGSPFLPARPLTPWTEHSGPGGTTGGEMARYRRRYLRSRRSRFGLWAILFFLGA